MNRFIKPSFFFISWPKIVVRSNLQLIISIIFFIQMQISNSFIISQQSFLLHNQQSTTKTRKLRLEPLSMGVRGKKIRKEIKREKEMITPPRINTPYGPIRFNRPLTMCDICTGLGKVYCNVRKTISLILYNTGITLYESVS